MKRRDFLKAAAAIPFAAAFPISIAEPAGLTLAAIRRARNALTAGVDSSYVAFLHPAQWFDIRRLRALDLWSSEYREWRLKRRNGAQTETLDELMARVKQSAEAEDVKEMRDDLDAAARSGEVGSYESFRFIVSEKVAA